MKYAKFRNILQSFCSLLLILLVIEITYIAVMRYVFNSTPAWGESIALLIMVWFSLTTSALAVSKDTHLKMDLIERFVNKKNLIKIEYITVLLWILFGLVMVIYGTNLTILANENIMTGVGLPSSILFASVPFTGIIFIVEGIKRGVDLKCQQIQ